MQGEEEKQATPTHSQERTQLVRPICIASI